MYGSLFDGLCVLEDEGSEGERESYNLCKHLNLTIYMYMYMYVGEGVGVGLLFFCLFLFFLGYCSRTATHRYTEIY